MKMYLLAGSLDSAQQEGPDVGGAAVRDPVMAIVLMMVAAMMAMMIFPAHYCWQSTDV